MNNKDFSQIYPADFIAEGVDQTRGWFYTLHAISTMVKDSVAFKNVISNGLVLDKSGNKMSKRLGNAVDPFATIDEYGSDPLRWYMITNASPWDNLKFDIEGVEEARRKFFGTLYNTYSFFALYANVDGFTNQYPPIAIDKRPEIDRWIISLLNTLIKETDTAYETYEPTKAGRAIADFVNDNLSNWYVRLNRKRFWGGEMTDDKLSAYQTLYECLVTVAKLMSPIAPFYADRLYLDLGGCLSVHLTDFPTFDEQLIDKNMEECMQLAQQASSMILALRRKADKKVRQPLTKVVVPAQDEKMRQQLQHIADLIKTEVNVKEFDVLSPDVEPENLVKKIKPNFKTLGKKYGKQMKEIADEMTRFTKTQINEIERTGKYNLSLASGEVIITAEDVEIYTEDIPGWLVANEGQLTVALDITITDELRKEGIARELVNRIQNLRKAKGFEITDRIAVKVSSNPLFDEAIIDFANYVKGQVLADEIVIVNETLEDRIDIEEVNLTIGIKRVNG
jgi:isoleucyl-tRNA synthetase